MNAIQCKFCKDILIPIKCAGIRTCFCRTIQMLVVPAAEVEHNNLIEVKLFYRWRSMSLNKRITQITDKKYINMFARVIQINDPFLLGKIDTHEFTDEDRASNSIFYQNKSQIVIAPMDTQGVTVVDEWSNPNLEMGWENIELIAQYENLEEI